MHGGIGRARARTPVFNEFVCVCCTHCALVQRWNEHKNYRWHYKHKAPQIIMHSMKIKLECNLCNVKCVQYKTVFSPSFTFIFTRLIVLSYDYGFFFNTFIFDIIFVLAVIECFPKPL